MKKLVYVFSMLCAGLLMASCVDKHEEVDEDVKPSWLGSSIYDQLASTTQTTLEGPFSTYLWLVDQLNEKETLSRTGSKTVFPANDAAFDRFFAPGGNEWGITRKEDLSESQKKMLLYSSMFDNAMLVNMMSNVNNGNTVAKGMAMKHATSLAVIDTVTRLDHPAQTYVNNPYFRALDTLGTAYVVSDNTIPMVVHFTREFMLNNSMTTLGPQSDFSVLMGREYNEGDAYVFRNKVIHKDVTCQNGYIHQVDNVITQPGNMAQLMKRSSDTQLMSRMLDRFAMPIENADATKAYNDWAEQNNRPTLERIYEVRYMSENSYDNRTQRDPQRERIDAQHLLPYDLGWNQYYVATTNTTSANGDGRLSDIAAMLVPTDSSVRAYFLPGGAGAFLIDQYGAKPNTADNLEENIDSIPQDKIKVLLSNLMQTRMTRTVPSVFSTVTNTASDLMGLSLNDLRRVGEAYDVRIANNGVLYMLNHMIAPPEFSAVSAPATILDNMKVINWIIQNKSRIGSDENVYSIGLDYYTYLLAMSANFAQFLPTDAAFYDKFYIDPATLSHEVPEAVRFYYDENEKSRLHIDRHRYNPVTHEVTDSIGRYDMDNSADRDVVVSLLVDMMNMNTIVLKKGEHLGDRNYYVTKLGAGVHVTGGNVADRVATSAQIDGGLPASNITTVYDEDNGVAYELDYPLQMPTQSVWKVLESDDRFFEFRELCTRFDADLMAWLGISSEPNSVGVAPIDQYTVFHMPNAPDYKYSTDATTQAEMARYQMATYENDNVVKFFNTFNYTVYAPNNEAMEAAYAAGLPRWDDIISDYLDYEDGTYAGDGDKLKGELQKKVDLIMQFIRYHFQNNSVFADTYGDSDVSEPQTFLPNRNNINMKLRVNVSDGELRVYDEYDKANGTYHSIVASAPGKIVNRMTRDVILDARFDLAKKVYTSSFAVVHEIDRALCPNSDGRFSTSVSASRKRR